MEGKQRAVARIRLLDVVRNLSGPPERRRASESPQLSMRRLPDKIIQLVLAGDASAHRHEVVRHLRVAVPGGTSPT